MAKLIFEFPNEESKESFLAWFSCCAESKYLENESEVAFNEDRKPITKFDYSKAFPAWGYNPILDGLEKVVEARE